MTGIKVEKLSTEPLTPGQLRHAFWDVILCTPRSMTRGTIEEQFRRVLNQLDKEEAKPHSELASTQPPEASIFIACDGACKGNPGPGGWAFVAHIDDDIVAREAGHMPGTTNNRMELVAVIRGLAWACLGHAHISITVDSKYVKDGITKWIDNWKKNGWKTANKRPVKNRDLWAMLDEARQDLEIEWLWVRGHSGDKWNEMADELASRAARGA